MKLKYTKQDIENAMDFIRQNPDASFKDWRKNIQTTWTEKDDKTYSDLKYKKYQMGSGNYFLAIKAPHFDELNHFLDKYYFNTSYFDMMSFYFTGPIKVFGFGNDKLFDIDNWQTSQEYGIKFYENDNIMMIYHYQDDDSDERLDRNYHTWKELLTDQYVGICLAGSVCLFLKNQNIDSPVKDLFSGIVRGAKIEKVLS